MAILWERYLPSKQNTCLAWHGKAPQIFHPYPCLLLISKQISATSKARQLSADQRLTPALTQAGFCSLVSLPYGRSTKAQRAELPSCPDGTRCTWPARRGQIHSPSSPSSVYMQRGKRTDLWLPSHKRPALAKTAFEKSPWEQTSFQQASVMTHRFAIATCKQGAGARRGVVLSCLYLLQVFLRVIQNHGSYQAGAVK